MMGYGEVAGMGGFGWVWIVLVLPVVLALGVWGRSTVFGSRGSTPEPTPLEVLRRRYAAGEITAAEFEQARRALT